MNVLGSLSVGDSPENKEENVEGVLEILFISFWLHAAFLQLWRVWLLSSRGVRAAHCSDFACC